MAVGMTVSESENPPNSKLSRKIDRKNIDIETLVNGSALQDFSLNFFRRSEGKSF